MKVRVTYDTPQMKVNEVFSGDTAEAVVNEMKKTVASHLNFALRLAIGAMGPAQFAQEVVKKYNDATGKRVPLPTTCSEFLEAGAREGIVTFLDRN